MTILTATTDPSTVMFEGHPDVTIASIEVSLYDDSLFYVKVGDVPTPTLFGTTQIKRGNNHAHDANGYDLSDLDTKRWPRVIPRPPVLDHTKPLAVRLIGPTSHVPQRTLDDRKYKIIGRAIDNPKHFIIAPSFGDAATLVIDPRTGRLATPNASGSNLQFYNPPITTTENSVIYTTTGRPVAVTLTLTDGIPTGVKLND